MLSTRKISFPSIFPLLFLILTAPSMAATIVGTVADFLGNPVTRGSVIYFHANSLTTPIDLDSGIVKLNRKGEFRLKAMPSGEYLFHVVKPGEGIRILGKGNERGYVLTVQNEPEYRVDIQVTHAPQLRIRFQSKGIRNALKGSVHSPTRRQWWHILGGQTFIYGLPEGETSLFFSAGVANGSLATSLGLREYKDTTISLEPDEGIKGKVVDESGKAISQAIYRSKGGFSRINNLTESDGSFYIYNYGRDIDMQFSAQGYRDTLVHFSSNEMSNNYVIVLREAKGWIRGQLNYPSDSLHLCHVGANSLEYEDRGQRKKGISHNVKAKWLENGDFVLDGLYHDYYEVRASCQGFNWRIDTVAINTDLGLFELEQSVNLSAVVIDSLTRQPLDTFYLKLFPDADHASKIIGTPLEKVKMDQYSGGKFEVSSQHQGKNVVCIRASGYIMKCFDLFLPDDAKKEIQLALAPACSLLVILREGGEPLPNKSVNIFWKNPSRYWNDQTDAQGEVKFTEVIPGQYTLSILHLQEHREQFRLDHSDTIVIDLQKDLTISGIVVDEQNHPVNGLFLNAFPEKMAGTMSSVPSYANNGKFEILGLEPGSYSLQLSWVKSFSGGKDHPYPFHTETGIQAGTSDLRIVIPQLRKVKIIPFSDNTSLDSERFTLQWSIESIPHFLQEHEFLVEKEFDLPIGQKFSYTLSSSGFLTVNQSEIIPEGKGTHIIRIPLNSGASLRGVVLVRDNQKLRPPKEVLDVVEVKDSFQSHFIRHGAKWEPIIRTSTTTKADGSFLLKGVTPGIAPLAVYDNDGRILHHSYQSHATSPCTLVVEQTSSLSGRIDNRLNKQNKKKTKHAFLSSRQNRLVVLASSVVKNGRFYFSDVPPGVYQVCLDTPSKNCRRVEIKKSTNSTSTELRFSPPPHSRNRRVLIQNLEQLPLQGVSLFGPDMAQYPNGNNNDQIEFADVPDGPLRFSVIARQKDPSIVYQIIQDAEAVPKKGWIELDLPKGGLWVEIQDLKGRPLPKAMVTLTPFHSEKKEGSGNPIQAYSDQAGQVYFAGLKPGTHQLFAIHPFLASQPQRVTVDTIEQSTPHKFQLKKGAGWKVQVICSGFPLENYQFTLHDSAGTSLLKWPFQQSKTEDFSGNLLPGNYRLTVTSPGMASRVIDLSVTKQNIKTKVEMDPSGWVELDGKWVFEKDWKFLPEKTDIASTALQIDPWSMLPGDTTATVLLTGAPALPGSLSGAGDELGRLHLRTGELEVMEE